MGDYEKYLAELKVVNYGAWQELTKMDKGETNQDIKEIPYPTGTVEYVLRHKDKINSGYSWEKKFHAKLTKLQAKVFDICLVGGMTHGDCASMLGCTRQNITKIVKAIHKRLGA